MKPTQPGKPNRYYCNNENCPEEWHNTPNYHKRQATEQEEQNEQEEKYYQES